MRAARDHVHDVSQSRAQIAQELDALKILIEYCVISGENPTQAKLSHTVSQMNHLIQEHHRHVRSDSDFYYTGTTPYPATITFGSVSVHQSALSALSVHPSALGAKGATGP